MWMQFYYLDHSSSLLLWKWIFLRKQQRMRMQWRRKRLLLADSSSVILWRMRQRKRMRRNLLIFVLETCAARCTTKKGCNICIPFCIYNAILLLWLFLSGSDVPQPLLPCIPWEHSVVSGILHPLHKHCFHQ